MMRSALVGVGKESRKWGASETYRIKYKRQGGSTHQFNVISMCMRNFLATLYVSKEKAAWRRRCFFINKETNRANKGANIVVIRYM